MMTVNLTHYGKNYSFYNVVKLCFNHGMISPLTICYLDDKGEYHEESGPIPDVLTIVCIEEEKKNGDI